MKKPKNYWTLVFGRCAHILDTRPGVSPKDAHKLALYEIDKELAEKDRQLTMIRDKEPQV